MNRFLPNKLVTIGILVFCILGGGAYYLSSDTDGNRKVSNIGVVKRTDIVQRVTVAGTIVPNRKTTITAPYSGYIKKMFVKIGDVVKKGDPIVSIVQSLQSSEPVYPLRAPLSGTVVQIEKTEGEYVKEGDPKEFIIRIDDISKLFILANVPEIELVKIKKNQEATIRASAILNKSYKGLIREISLAAKEQDRWGNNSQVQFPIKIEIIDFAKDIKPGMSVIADIIANKKVNVLALRHEYIHNKSGKFSVELEEGKEKEVQVGIYNEEFFEITKGLNEGDRVKQINYLDI